MTCRAAVLMATLCCGGLAVNRPILKSPRREYMLCMAVHDSKDGIVYEAVSPRPGARDCQDMKGVSIGYIVKCGYPHMVETFRSEYQHMLDLKARGWSVHVLETFMNGSNPCLVMKPAGLDFKAIREVNPRVWHPITLATIGLQLVDILTELRFVHNKLHGDLRMENIAISPDDPSRMVLLDYGSMTNISGAEDLAFLSTDIRQAMLSLRYLANQDKRFYEMDEFAERRDLECPHIVEKVCSAITYALQHTFDTPQDYSVIRGMLLDVLSEAGAVYLGRINWDKKSLAAFEKSPAGVPLVRVPGNDITTTKIAECMYNTTPMFLGVLVILMIS